MIHILWIGICHTTVSHTVDPHCFDAQNLDADPDPAQNLDADPDPGGGGG